MAGLERYAAERVDQDPKFTRHPTTWLNKAGWTDAPQTTGPRRDSPQGRGGFNFLEYAAAHMDYDHE